MQDQIITLCVLGSAAACMAGAITTLSIDPARRLSLAVGAIDRPGGRHHHHGHVPRLGGFAIVLGILSGLLMSGLLIQSTAGLELDPFEALPLLGAASMVFIMGLIDDMRSISFVSRLVCQALAAALVVAAGWQIDHVYLPVLGQLQLGPLAPVITVIWIVFVVNAINMMDGLNGLATSAVAIIASTMFIIEVTRAHPFSAFVFASIAGSCLGFLIHNWSGRIFMGDCGSMTLGFLLVATAIQSSSKAASPTSPHVQGLALAVPIIDALLVIIWRFISSRRLPLARRCLGVFRGDRNHLHHLLYQLVRRQDLVVLWTSVLVLLSCGAAQWVELSGNSSHATAMISLGALIILAVRQTGIARRDRAGSAERSPIATGIGAAQPNLTDSR